MKNLLQKIKYNRLSGAEKFIDKVFKEMIVFKNNNEPDSKFWSWGGHVIIELDMFGDLFVSRVCILQKIAETKCFENADDILQFVKAKFSDYKKIQVVEVQDDRYSNF